MKAILAFLLLLLPIVVCGQVISNIRLESTHDKVWVWYDLESNVPQDISILFVSDVKGKITPVRVTGAVGRVSAGLNHKIEWEALADVGEFGGNLYAELSIMSCGNTIKDIDGNVYKTVKIGAQCWMQSNLEVSKYRNGDNIPTGLSNAQWSSTTSGAYAIYKDDNSNDALYGKLYNWYAVKDSRGICPTGWHVPADGEWTTLTDFLGGESVAGGKMKSTTGWDSPNTGATNSSGFTGLPGGYRASGGGFFDLGITGFWWSSSVAGSGSAWYRYLYSNDASADRTNGDGYRRSGFSVRCARD